MRERGKRNTRRQRKERTNEIYTIERHIYTYKKKLKKQERKMERRR